METDPVMNNFASVIFLILFALSTLLTYLAIRRRWLPLVTAAAVGVGANMLFFFLFSLSQGNVFLHALAVGVLLGGLFAAMTVAIAAFFRNNGVPTVKS